MDNKNDYVTRGEFDDAMQKIDKKFDVVIEKLDGIAGEFKKFDEEQTLLSNKVSEHTDNLDSINEKLGIQA